MEDNSSILAISPIDGRYANKTKELNKYFSEFALIKYRFFVEIEWLKFLTTVNDVAKPNSFNKSDLDLLDDAYNNFSYIDAQKVKEIEATTQHDVKAIEYFVKELLEQNKLNKYCPFVHFACTSEDINNVSYALMLKDARDKVINPVVKDLQCLLLNFSNMYKSTPMLARTHGQDASPTTVGKEIYCFYSRIKRALGNFNNIDILGKFNGATGNYNAHVHAYSNIDWFEESSKFIDSLGLKVNNATTQIEPHDFVADILFAITNVNTILLDFSRDMWSYISLDYFKQKLKNGEVGSSTMPHKVNPILFENAEGNLGIASALATHLAQKLPVSRWQRDLSDSTAFRNVGLAISYTFISIKSLISGFSKLVLNEKRIESDLKDKWHLLAEPVQISMKKYGISKAYEELKDFTRGQKIDKLQLDKFIEQLKIPISEKEKLIKLTPEKYIGIADKIVTKGSN